MRTSITKISTPAVVLGYVIMICGIACCCLLYSFGTLTEFGKIFYVTGYGILSVSYYATTYGFAYLNRRLVEEKAAKYRNLNLFPGVAINVVGYREDPNYFRQCLESVQRLEYSSITHVTVVVDGNEAEDVYMADIAKSVFGDRVVELCLDQVPCSTQSTSLLGLGFELGNVTRPVYVVTQPHMGKREAIYTAYIIAREAGVEFFVNTDSDTILDGMAVDELVSMTVGDGKVDAVAGCLYIFNRVNLLTYLTAARYFMAFNVERASQGYHGVVGCISGPLGLYRTSSVRLVVEDWVHQTFMGRKCTFGDDRHMTNKILGAGGRILYTHRSFAETETPTIYSRFVAQQTRWSKSYWRELFLQSGWATRHWFLMVETVFGTLLPVLIVVTLLRVVFERTWWSLLAITVVTFIIPAIRCLAVFTFFERNAIVFYGVLYPFLYLSTLLPVKFVALFTMGQTNWGTSSRKNLVKNYAPVVPVLVWILFILGGLTYKMMMA
jgi:hyaluronan synthase